MAMLDRSLERVMACFQDRRVRDARLIRHRIGSIKLIYTYQLKSAFFGGKVTHRRSAGVVNKTANHFYIETN